MTTDTSSPSATLAAFAANLRFEDIPAPVLRRAEDLLQFGKGGGSGGKDQSGHGVPPKMRE